MKKITIIALMLAMSPTVLWAGGKGYARLYAKISSNSTGRGLVYASTSPDVDETKFANEGNDKQNNPNKNVTLYAHAKAKDGFTFDGWSDKNDGAIVSTDNPIAVTIKCPADGNSDTYTDATRYANFSLAECPSFAITFKATANGTYNVVGKNGEDTVEIESTSVSSSDFNSGAKTHVQKLTLTATPNANCVFIGWYFIDVNNSKSYFSTDTSTEISVSVDTTIGADFVSASAAAIVVTPNGYDEYESLALAAVGASSGDTIKVLKSETVSSNLEVANGATLEIASGVEITVAADATLLIGGKLLNNGSISGAGTLALNYKTITQESQINVPFPYGTDGVETGKGAEKTDGTGDGTAGKYVKTHANTVNAAYPSNSTCENKLWFVTIVNGAGEVMRTTPAISKPAGVLCKVNRKIALNWITEVTAGYDDIRDAFTAADSGSGDDKSAVTYDNDKMVVLVDSKSNVYSEVSSSTLNKGFSLDCADNTISFKPKQFGGGYLMRFFNGSVSLNNKVMYYYVNFYNCSKAYIAKIDPKYASGFAFYDSANDANIDSLEGDSNKARVKYYGGGVYPSTLYSGSYKTTVNKVYWGRFGFDPEDYIADQKRYRKEKIQSNPDVWEIVKSNGNADHFFKVGEEDSDSLADAISKASLSGKTIELQKDYTLTENVEVSADSNITIDTENWAITGTGSIINNGVLAIVDNSGCVTPGVVDVNIVCNSGNLYLSGSNFSKDITINGGKCWLVDGTYSGALSVASNLNPIEVVEVCAARFATMSYAHGEIERSILELCPNGKKINDAAPYFVIKAPSAFLESLSPYKVVAFNAADNSLFVTSKTSTKRSSYTNLSDWIRAVEIANQVATFAVWAVDATLTFDRDVGQGTVSASAMGQSMSTSSDVVANKTTSMLVPMIRDKFTQYEAPWTYTQFLPGGEHADHVSLSVSSMDANTGTTCLLEMRLASGVKNKSYPYDWSYNISNSVVIAAVRLVFGAGDKVAMLQTVSGAVPDENFFDTLAAAIASDATTGKTIKLCNDCAEEIEVSKACTIDTNGFEFSGTLTAGEGLSKTEANGVYVFSAPDPADVYVEQVKVDNVVSQVVSDDWLVANEISPDAEPEEIQAAVQEKLKEEDTNGNAKWENLVIGQKADESAAVTAANGGTASNVTVAVTFSVPTNAVGETVNTGYTVKYAFDKVDASTGSVVENGTGDAQATPTLDIESVKAEEGPAYFKMRAVLEASDDSGVTAEVPVEKTIGVLKVESDAAVTIIPVPWKSLGDGDIKASELVHAASLSEDDELTVYDSKGNSKSWRVNDAGKWIPVPTYETGEGQQTQQVQSQVNDDLKRGQGAILKRSKPKETEIVLIGQAVTNATETIETTIAAATSSTEPSWNLVASPKMAEVEIASKAFSDKTADEIIVPTAGTPKHYTYKNNAWGYPGVISTKTVTMPDGSDMTVVKSGHKTGDTKVPAGTGFWYINKDSENKDKKITW